VLIDVDEVLVAVVVNVWLALVCETLVLTLLLPLLLALLLVSVLAVDHVDRVDMDVVLWVDVLDSLADV